MQRISLSFVGSRKYVHSTTFTKFLLNLNPQINQLEIKFRKLSTAASYTLFLSHTDNISPDVHGTFSANNQITNFSFVAIENADLPNIIEEPLSDINNIQDKNSLVDAIVSDSKKLCDNLYNIATQQLFMVKIVIKHLDLLKYPTNLSSTVKQHGSRINVKYKKNGLEIADLLGVVRQKNE